MSDDLDALLARADAYDKSFWHSQLVTDLAAALRTLQASHEGCTHTTDTLRRARELAAKLRTVAVDHRDWTFVTPYLALLDLLDRSGETD